MRALRIGDIIKYTEDPHNVEGPYALVFRAPAPMSNGQVVWFGEKRHCFKYNIPYYKYSISGTLYAGPRKDCKIVYRIPKKIKKRVNEALQYVVKSEANYYESSKFTNLDMIEVLAKFKKLI